MKTMTFLGWAARFVAALIMLQTLYFKFSGSEESIYIFKTVGMEPWGRIGVGVMELIAAILLLINATAWLGATLGAGLMAGAISMHFMFLGISVNGDNGQLFLYASIVLICCLYVLLINRLRISEILRKLINRSVA